MERYAVLVCYRGDTIQYHGGLRAMELGQAPMLLVFHLEKVEEYIPTFYKIRYILEESYVAVM